MSLASSRHRTRYILVQYCSTYHCYYPLPFPLLFTTQFTVIHQKNRHHHRIRSVHISWGTLHSTSDSLACDQPSDRPTNQSDLLVTRYPHFLHTISVISAHASSYLYRSASVWLVCSLQHVPGQVNPGLPFIFCRIRIK